MKKGITLIELIIVIVLLSIMTVFFAWTFVVGLRVWYSGENRAGIRQDGNLAMGRMVRELSQAYSIRDAAADEITFWADALGTEEVTYDVEDGNLKRTVDDSTQTILAYNTQVFTLAYRDVNDDLMNLPEDTASQGKRDNIRVIIVSLTLNDGDETVSLSSSVYTRNQGLE